MSLIFRLAGRQQGCLASQLLSKKSINGLKYVRPVTLDCTPAVAPKPEGHDERNMKLGRPQSPHLTIYKPQLTSMLSISHRATGMILSFYAIAFGAAGIFLECPPEYYIEQLRCAEIGAGPIFALKFLLAFPLSYHFWNGIRHLAWDTARFLSIKEVYATGWAMLAVAIASSLALSAL